MTRDAPDLTAERTDGGLVLREDGNSDAYLYADADTVLDLGA